MSVVVGLHRMQMTIHATQLGTCRSAENFGSGTSNRFGPHRSNAAATLVSDPRPLALA